MNSRGERIEPFALALGLLAALTVAFYANRNGGAVIMGATCAGGLVVARALGFSNRSLVPLALGLVAVLVLLWGQFLPGDSHTTSAIAHAAGGLLVGWALSEYLRDRYIWALWPVAVLLGVFMLGVAWELVELAGDRLFTTALIPKLSDSIADVAFGTLGGVAGMLVSILIPPPSHRE